MKSGLGLYPHLLSEENYRFVYQAGATHIVAHLPGFARREGRGLPSKTSKWSTGTTCCSMDLGATSRSRG